MSRMNTHIRTSSGKLQSLAMPVPEVLRMVGEESKRNGGDKLTSHQIDRVIKAARAARPKRK